MWNRLVTVGIMVPQDDKLNTIPDFALYAGLGTFELELKKANAYLKELEKATKISKLGANRWTDNIFALHSWIRDKFPSVSINDLNQQFGIPEDIDYIE